MHKNLIEKIVSFRTRLREIDQLVDANILDEIYKPNIGKDNNYLEFLTSEHHWDLPIKEANEDKPTNPIRRIESAFNAIGEGKNPISGGPMPTYGSKEYRGVVKQAHEYLKQKHGFVGGTITHLLSGNAKLQHSTGEHILSKEGKPIFSQGFELSPAHNIHGINTCPKRTEIHCPKTGKLVGGCAASCLGKTAGGNIQFPKATSEAKLKKTNALFDSPEHMAVAINHHIEKEKRAANVSSAEFPHGYKYAVRMNVTSDIPQAAYKGLRTKHPDVQFYDYTKEPKQVLHHLAHKNEPGHQNLHLTFSSTGVHHPQSNWSDARKVLQAGGNVAMVMNNKAPKRSPKTYYPGKENEPKYALPTHVHDVKTGTHYPVINGDFTRGDARFLDEPGHVVGLYKKGHSNFGSFAVDYDKEKKLAQVKD